MSEQGTAGAGAPGAAPSPTGAQAPNGFGLRRQPRVSVAGQVAGIVGVMAGVLALYLWLSMTDARYALSYPAVIGDMAERADPNSGLAPASWWWWALVIGTTLLALGAGLSWYAQRLIAHRAAVERFEADERERLRGELDDAVGAPESELVRLVNANRALLDEYQRPVRTQARTSYVYSQFAIFAGLFVVLLGVVIVVSADKSAARLAVASLASVGACSPATSREPICASTSAPRISSTTTSESRS